MTKRTLFSKYCIPCHSRSDCIGKCAQLRQHETKRPKSTPKTKPRTHSPLQALSSHRNWLKYFRYNSINGATYRDLNHSIATHEAIKVVNMALEAVRFNIEQDYLRARDNLLSKRVPISKKKEKS